MNDQAGASVKKHDIWWGIVGGIGHIVTWGEIWARVDQKVNGDATMLGSTV